MGTGIILTGMVLHAMPVGEYDRRITVLTKERGKITAFARGARRPTSQLLAATGPFSFGEFELYEGRSTYNVKQISVSNYFREIAGDPEKMCYGFYVLEVADYFSQENSDGRELLKLLYQTLRALGSDALDNRLVRRIFELRTLLAEGVYPNVFSCQSCGGKEGLTRFSLRRGGMICENCMAGEGSIAVGTDTLYTLQYVLSAELGKLYTFRVSQDVLSEFGQVVERVFAEQACHTFRSLDIGIL